MEYTIKTYNTGLKYYQCPSCDYESAHKYVIKNHYNRVHDDTIIKQKRGRKTKNETLKKLESDCQQIYIERNKCNKGTDEFIKLNNKLVSLHTDFKEYRDNVQRKEYLKAYAKEQKKCEICEKYFTKSNLTSHNKTKYHLKVLGGNI